MQKFSIKSKIAIWFAVVLILVCAVTFYFITAISGSAAERDTRSALIRTVEENASEIKYDDGKLHIENKFRAYKNRISTLIYAEDGTEISSHFPYDEFLDDIEFEDGSINKVRYDGETYLVYDMLVKIRRHPDVWVRGVTATQGGSLIVSSVKKTALIAFPLLILLATAGGYLLAKHLLRPINQISRIAEKIGSSGDLSKRIIIEGNQGDELYQLAQTFNRMFDRLETNFEAERQFTSDASHELRTPVTVILAQCEYAFENASGEEELYEAIGTIQRHSYRMAHLIESLLSFTRMEQNTESANFDEVNISELVSSTCEEQSMIAQKEIILSADIVPEIRMRAERQMFTRMLINLIQNVYRYGKENGTIHVCLKKEASSIVLSVADDGIGIAAEDLPKIWKRFYRADKSRSGSSGLGLGLAMVKQIAEYHGGNVQVQSTLGAGSIFTVVFPIHS